MERRAFLTHSAMATVALGLMPESALAQSAGGPAHRNLFLPLLGTAFTVIDDRGHVHRPTLAEVRPGPETPGLDQFTLVFRDTAEDAPCSGLCWVRSPETGWFQLQLDAMAGRMASATFCLIA